MDISLWNDMYLDFRSKLLGPIYSTDEIFGLLARNVASIAKSANIGYIHCSYYIPVSRFEPNGLSGEYTAYHDQERLPAIPATSIFSETMSTGEQGSFTFQAHPIEGHSFSDTERQLVQLLSWDFFILTGRAHLIGNTRKASITDPMTGAYNQAGIFMFSQKVIGENLGNYTASFINLKNFKYINKSMGDPIGDLALKMYVNKISQYLDKTEIIARLGGDNFFALVKKDHQEEFISRFSTCEMVLGQGPKTVNLRIQARMGIYPIENNVEINDVLSCAATALQTAKAIKTQDIIFFTKEMLVRTMHQKEISNEFHNAIRNKEFVVFYQPPKRLSAGFATRQSSRRWTSFLFWNAKAPSATWTSTFSRQPARTSANGWTSESNHIGSRPTFPNFTFEMRILSTASSTSCTSTTCRASMSK